MWKLRDSWQTLSLLLFSFFLQQALGNTWVCRSSSSCSLETTLSSINSSNTKSELKHRRTLCDSPFILGSIFKVGEMKSRDSSSHSAWLTQTTDASADSPNNNKRKEKSFSSFSFPVILSISEGLVGRAEPDLQLERSVDPPHHAASVVHTQHVHVLTGRGLLIAQQASVLTEGVSVPPGRKPAG